jgi:hypothetical protein
MVAYFKKLSLPLVQNGRRHARVRFALQKLADKRTSIHQLF